MTEKQLALWTMSVPITSEINVAMQDFNDFTYATSKHHREATDARIERDASDLSKISRKLNAFSPFFSDPTLRNIINGIVANEDIKVHEYEAVGNKTIERMIGQPVFSFSINRMEKAKTLRNSTALQVAPHRTIDSIYSVLFQRFLLVFQTGDLSLEDMMSFELSPYPSSLFEDNKILRKADKPQAVNDHCTKVLGGEGTPEIMPSAHLKTERYVLDGGSLLHKLKWKKGDTYGKIVRAYADFTTKHYETATVVFDGYSAGPSIKDNTQQRRGQAKSYATVNFTGETEFDGNIDEFLFVSNS